MTKAQDVSRAESLEVLRGLLPRGSEVRVLVRHVSASGMTRWIDVFVIHNGSLVWIGSRVAEVLGSTWSSKYQGVKREGVGMDMGFDLVYSLSARLYGHADEGGYALTHRWI